MEEIQDYQGTEKTEKEEKEIKTSFKSIEEALSVINALKSDLYKKNKVKAQLAQRVKQLEEELSQVKASELALRKELEELKPYKEKYQTVETARRNELLERLPEDKREEYKDFDLTILEKVIKDFVINSAKPNISLGAEKSNVVADNVTKYESLTTEQINDLAVKDPLKLQTLYKDYLVRQTKGG